MLRLLPAFIESAYNAYQSQLPRPISTRTMFKIYLFAERSQWEDFTKKFAAPDYKPYLKIKKGAYYLNGASVAYNIGRTRTFAAIAHEGWHQFNSKHFKYRLPSWLDEGVATSFEISRYQNGRFRFEPHRNIARLAALKKTILENKTIPLKTLIALNPGEVMIGSDTNAIAAFYAQSYALVRFLREQNYGIRLPRFQHMLADAVNGTWPVNNAEKMIAANRNIPLTVRWNRSVGTKLFEKYIGLDFENLQNEYIRFCKKLVYHLH